MAVRRWLYTSLSQNNLNGWSLSLNSSYDSCASRSCAEPWTAGSRSSTLLRYSSHSWCRWSFRHWLVHVVYAAAGSWCVVRNLPVYELGAFSSEELPHRCRVFKRSVRALLQRSCCIWFNSKLAHALQKHIMIFRCRPVVLYIWKVLCFQWLKSLNQFMFGLLLSALMLQGGLDRLAGVNKSDCLASNHQM